MGRPPNNVATFATVFIAWIWAADVTPAQQPGAAPGAELPYRTIYSQTTGSDKEWFELRVFRDVKGYEPRPDPITLAKVSVEWSPPQRDALGNLLSIKGRLVVDGDDSSTKRPVHWFQGITLFMAKSPGEKPDWSAGVKGDDTFDRTLVIDPSGEFSTTIDLREGVQDRGQPQARQFGLSLASHQPGGVYFNSKQPAVKASIAMLTVPAANDLGVELELINRAARWPDYFASGVDLIRAVNALQRIGKDRAIEVMNRYLDLADEFEYSRDRQIIFWIIRLLFVPADPSERIPPPLIGVGRLSPDDPQAIHWPIDPIALIDEIPFLIQGRTAILGVPEHPSSHVRWACEKGVIRSTPITPRENPLVAADKLLKSKPFVTSFNDWRRIGHVRCQALAMLDNVEEFQNLQYGGPGSAQRPRSSERCYFPRRPKDARWSKSLQHADELHIRWDPKREEFVAH